MLLFFFATKSNLFGILVDFNGVQTAYKIERSDDVKYQHLIK